MNKVLCGDMRGVLPTLKDGSVDMCVTSPPYFGQRAYAGETECLWADGWYGELGREPEMGMYVDHLLECFRELWRVLSPYGTVFLNLGGCYAGSGGAGGDYNIGGLREGQPKYGPKRPKGYKPLDYIPVPHLVAMGLQREGWYLRAPIVWHKPAPMPGSMGTWRWERCRVTACPNCGALASFHKSICRECRYNKDTPTEKPGKVRPQESDPYRLQVIEGRAAIDYVDCPGCPKCEPHGGYRLYYGAWRPTTAHEYVFLMSKTNRYYCDQDAVRTAQGRTEATRKRYKYAPDKSSKKRGPQDGKPDNVWSTYYINPRGGANARSVQSWPTANLGLDHFAAFSVELAAWCIRAGTSPRGYCPKCNRPWVRVVDKPRHPFGKDTRTPGQHTPTGDGKPSGSAMQKWIEEHPITTLGWKATCECGLGPRPGIVLDPFGGAGTVALAAKGLGRSYILCEISEEYVAMSEARIRKGFTPNKKPKKPAKEVKVEGVGKVTELRLGL